MPANGEEARDFILSNPELIKYFWRKGKHERAEEDIEPLNVHPEVGNCMLIHPSSGDNPGTLTWWLKVRVSIAYHRLAALVKDIDRRIYTKERALDRRMEASYRCHRRFCINPHHLIWEDKDHSQARGSKCVGYLRKVDQYGGVTYVQLCPHGRCINTACVVITPCPY